MIAYITSIYENTADICKWSLERNGFTVFEVKGQDSLAEKLKYIYMHSNDDFLRVDADVIPNKNITYDYVKTLNEKNVWWYQFLTYDWYKQDLTHGGIQFIKREALSLLRENIDKYMKAERPESQMYRLPEFHYPRRGKTIDIIAGLHGYKQSDTERVKQTKNRRKQEYDWELYERITKL